MFHYYKGKDLEDVFSNKYEDFEKYKIACPAFPNSKKKESGTDYDWDDEIEFELAEPNGMENNLRFVERAYDIILLNFDCDGCSFVRKNDVFRDGGCIHTFGFFLIRKGRIVEFITEDFMRGYLKCLDNINKKVSGTFAETMKKMGAI